MPPAQTRLPRDLTGLVIGLTTLIWAAFVHSHAYSSNEASRLASIEALVERGTWSITASPFGTIDKIKIGDQFYSDKPPLLSWIGAGVYGLLHHGLGLRLQATGCEAEQAPAHCRALWAPAEADWAYVTLTLLLVSAPATLILALAYRLARRSGFTNVLSLVGVAVLGLGTALFPYSTVFSNHVPAAAALFGAVYLLLTRPEPGRMHLALAGLGATLSAAIDLSTGIFWIGLALYVAWRRQAGVIWFIVGGVLPGLVSILLNVQIVGAPWPPQMYVPGYQYEGSSLGTGLSGFQRAANVPRYAFDLLVGARGVLAFFPIVIWGVWAMAQAALARDWPRRPLAWTLGLASVGYTLYFIFSTDNFGGYAYSPRWLLIPVSLLAAFAFTNPTLYQSLKVRWVLIGLAVYSIWAAYLGALNPWVPAYPPLHLAWTAPQPPASLAVVASGYSDFYAIDPDVRAQLGANNVQPRWFEGGQGIVLPSGQAWWIVGPEVTLAPEIAREVDLPASGPFAIRADRTPQAERWLAQFQQTVHQSVDLAPDPAQPVETLSLPLGFDTEFTWLGYQLTCDSNTLTLITAWQVETALPPHAQRRVFAQLLNQGGQIAAQHDAFAARPDSLRTGDRLFQVQRLPLEALPAGHYWLQIGVYDSATGERLRLPDGRDRLLLPVIEHPVR